MSVRRLVPLTLGWQELDRSVALDGEPQGRAERILIPGWLVERGDGGLSLFDTGYDPAADPAELAFPGFPPPEVLPLPDAFFGATVHSSDTDCC